MNTYVSKLVYEWMNEWMNKWMNEWINEWENKWTKQTEQQGFHLKTETGDLCFMSYKKKLYLLATVDNSRSGVKLADKLLT